MAKHSYCETPGMPWKKLSENSILDTRCFYGLYLTSLRQCCTKRDLILKKDTTKTFKKKGSETFMALFLFLIAKPSIVQVYLPRYSIFLFLDMSDLKRGIIIIIVILPTNLPEIKFSQQTVQKKKLLLPKQNLKPSMNLNYQHFVQRK